MCLFVRARIFLFCVRSVGQTQVSANFLTVWFYNILFMGEETVRRSTCVFLLVKLRHSSCSNKKYTWTKKRKKRNCERMVCGCLIWKKWGRRCVECDKKIQVKWKIEGESFIFTTLTSFISFEFFRATLSNFSCNRQYVWLLKLN